MKLPIPRTRIATALAGIAFTLAAGQALGSAFALQEQSASGMGSAFAGGAAASDDVSDIWFNPASIAQLRTAQVAAGVHFIVPSFKFKDNGSAAAAFQPLGGTGGDAGSLNVVPNVYLAVPVNPQWTIGLAVNVPFGLVTEYDSDWLGRFQGIKSDVRTINVNPVVAWRPVDNFAVGVGIDWQRIDAEFTSAVNYSAGLAQAAQQGAAAGLIPAAVVPSVIAATPGLEARTRVKGNDSAWGWNVGMQWDATPQARIGAQYRSRIKYHIDGNATFDLPTPVVPAALSPVVGPLAAAVNAQLANGGITSSITLPDSANLSLLYRLNDRWDVMGDVQWTGWSVLKDLTFTRTSGGVLASTPENFDDSWRFAVGTTWRYNDAWTLRGGLAYDQTPVNTTDRTPRLPDADRYWVSLGAGYKFNRNWKADAGFTYIFLNSPDINQNAGSTARNGLIKGSYDENVTIFSAQVTYSF